jgi:hypothetical protein
VRWWIGFCDETRNPRNGGVVQSCPDACRIGNGGLALADSTVIVS